MKRLLLLVFALLPVAALANPTNLRVTDLQSTQATISWDAGPGETRFVVWGQSTGTYGTIWTPLETVVATSWTIYELTPGTSKKYLVNTGTGCWPSPCQTVAFTTLTPPIWKPAPKDQVAYVGRLKSIYLSFVASPAATITLLQAPDGMTVSSNYLRWKPQAWQLGPNVVQVQVANDLGFVEAKFVVTVR